MDTQAARYQAHPEPGSVDELESTFSWLVAERDGWGELPDGVAHWQRKHLDTALALVYREIVRLSRTSNLELVNLLEPRCEDPICPRPHAAGGRHIVPIGNPAPKTNDYGPGIVARGDVG